ncbi:hypothetical protein RSSM_06639 [Rhodopirellula sallentina SM41]|uniref:Uncharacterized protein n=1 Tax=Rhodopirellula sallentina SM41 TaxID=1263870 RepID=M5TRU3_9BACT|nr:hypothetical protein RSSM_06639 [Rhodopirellula sallentina SM41]
MWSIPFHHRANALKFARDFEFYTDHSDRSRTAKQLFVQKLMERNERSLSVGHRKAPSASLALD